MVAGRGGGTAVADLGLLVGFFLPEVFLVAMEMPVGTKVGHGAQVGPHAERPGEKDPPG